MLISNTDTVDWLIQASHRYPLLTAKEEIIFARHVQAWQEIKDIERPTPKQKMVMRRGKRAYDRFFQSNIRLAVNVAKKYVRVGGTQSLEDLIQEGLLGLQSGILRFDPTRGYKFSTYAYWWIKQGIIRSIERHGRTIRLPHGVNQTIKAAMDFMREHHRQTGRLPALSLVAEHCNVSELSLQHYLNHNASILSLDETVKEGYESSTYLDLLADLSEVEDSYNECGLMSEPLQDAVQHLSDKQRHVILSRYFHTLKSPPSFESIAQEVGTTRQMVQIHHKSALIRLQQYLRPSPKPEGTPARQSAA